jgi:hypothetical protein
MKTNFEKLNNNKINLEHRIHSLKSKKYCKIYAMREKLDQSISIL